jgi:hypothetical protein
MTQDEITHAMGRLNAAERARRNAIEDLIRLGVVRSKRLVADLGEALASRFYGVSLVDNANEPGYDLITRSGQRVQVRALRATPTRERSVMGAMKEPYDVLFAVKLTVDYEPLRAIEVPRAVLECYYPHGAGTHWTKRLEADTGVRRIPREELPR